MPYLVNGQLVPEQVIQEEFSRLSRDVHWSTIADESKRAQELRAAAESSAIDRILVEQLACNDSRPVDAAILAREIEAARLRSGCQSNFDEPLLASFAERNARVERMRRELVVGADKPTASQVEAFYFEHRNNFQQPELSHAAHIVKYVNEFQTEEAALAGIRLALAELERGENFADVANRHSDCSDPNGDVGQFPAGHMVEQFDLAIADLQPGQRTGIFRTPFGFHVALLIARTPPGIANFERVQGAIERVMTFSKQHEVYTKKIAELREVADIRWVSETGDQRA